MRRLDRAAIRGLVLAAALLAMSSAALAENSPVRLSVNERDVGIDGVVQIGTWAPILVDVENLAPVPLTVQARVILPDIDGDQVQYQRKSITIAGNKHGQCWLYAMPGMDTNSQTEWTVQVIDPTSGKLLASQAVSMSEKIIQPNVAVLGEIGEAPIGLDTYTEEYTQQEKMQIIRGLDPTNFPDRWFGLSLFQWIVWTPQGRDPGTIGPGVSQALHEWVRRGGHLVILLPAHGTELWSGQSMADLLPSGAIKSVTGVLPPMDVLGASEGPSSRRPIDINVFEASPEATTLFEYKGEPLALARQVGFGRTTTVGIDLTEPGVAKFRQPNGYRFWDNIFNWRSPAYTKGVIDAQIHANPAQMAEPSRRSYSELGNFAGSLVAMRDTAVPAVLAAIVLFAIYWVVAGPGGFFALKQRGMVRYSWLGFVATIAVFSAISWGGAMVLRPSSTMARHVSVLDISAGSDVVHVRSWLSLFVPTHGVVPINLAPDKAAEGYDTMSSPGLSEEDKNVGFFDPQRYAMDAGGPHASSTPFRATSKELTLDYLGTVAGGADGVWGLPQGKVVIGPDTWPQGELVHHLPGTMRNVTFIYSTGQRTGNGDIREPWYWHRDAWKPGERLSLSGPPLGAGGREVAQAMLTGSPIQWTGGHLLDLSHTPPSASDPFTAIEMLSFFSALPSPDYSPQNNFGNMPTAFSRSLGRSLDLSALLKMRRLIIMGYLQDSPLPAPLEVDGQPVPRATGFTVVRWIYDLP